MKKMKKAMWNFMMTVFVYSLFTLLAIVSGLMVGTLLATIVYAIEMAMANQIFGAFGIAAIILVAMPTTKVVHIIDLWDFNELLEVVLED